MCEWTREPRAPRHARPCTVDDIEFHSLTIVEPHHQDSALYPSIAQLERAAGFRCEDTAEQRLAKLEAALALGANDLREAVPLLADVLSIPTGDRFRP